MMRRNVFTTYDPNLPMGKKFVAVHVQNEDPLYFLVEVSAKLKKKKIISFWASLPHCTYTNIHIHRFDIETTDDDDNRLHFAIYFVHTRFTSCSPSMGLIHIDSHLLCIFIISITIIIIL